MSDNYPIIGSLFSSMWGERERVLSASLLNNPYNTFALTPQIQSTTQVLLSTLAVCGENVKGFYLCHYSIALRTL